MVNSSKWELSKKDMEVDVRFEDFDFETTKDIEKLNGIIGQVRAVEALDFGIHIQNDGYNIYVSGESGTGRKSYSLSLIEKVAKNKKVHRDYVYVFNFLKPDEPIALSFQPGEGKTFKKDMEFFINRIIKETPKSFSGSEYESRYQDIVMKFEQLSGAYLAELNLVAQDKGIKFVPSPKGLMSFPIKEDGTNYQEEEYNALEPEKIEEIQENSKSLAKDFNEYMNKMKELDLKISDKIAHLERQVVDKIVSYYISDMKEKHEDNKKVVTYLDDLQQDIISHTGFFKGKDKEDASNPLAIFRREDPKQFISRYDVNLFIDNTDTETAPVVLERNPSYYNIIGFAEYRNENGMYTTDFMSIKPGALHKANGGFLVINAKDMLQNPLAWEGLKRSIKTKKIMIENPFKQSLALMTTGLKPEPIDLDIKVVLIGDMYIYSLLYYYDDDFRELFRIMADFDIEIEKNNENEIKFAKFIADFCEVKKLKHFERDAVIETLKYSIKLASEKNKISARFNKITEIIYESNALSDENQDFIKVKDVQKAIQKKRIRNSKIEDRMNEMYRDGSYLIDVDGKKVGQINGLAVMQVGESVFGKPSRITASSYKGRYGILNIEREVAHSGSIHDKGVLILNGYIGNRYAKEDIPAMTTSITFEQNYSGIDGDSASSTELYVIISSIAGIPINQGIAVTGSMSQKGEIQPIGGVNEKIEGYYDVCRIKGLTGKQGVIIPIQNVKNLMLRDDIIKSVEEGQFHIYAISNVEEGLQILTGLTIAKIDEKVKAAFKKFSENCDEKKSEKGE
ncbi:MAG: AAA family ATPase [Proteocatella sp.]|nr:AAA family ATPase [Proteocatella sp.]MBP7907654.1 AAA family ATPase [Proteocatella sp.]MBP8653697.1 AAA family ATPase [Proteocatella sp.]MBP9658313.1 AAA family ATPase [Proteocatella sp.]MBP9966137.1 AAA family ATPase [Proteocatella sp.]